MAILFQIGPLKAPGQMHTLSISLKHLKKDIVPGFRKKYDRHHAVNDPSIVLISKVSLLEPLKHCWTIGH